MKNTQDTSNISRKTAVIILLAVLKDGKSVSSLTNLTEDLDPRDASFARMLSFGVLRFYQQLAFLIKPLMKKKLKAKDLDVELVILLAMYQILHTRVPDYAAVDAAVKLIRKSKKKWAASLVNAVLRSFLRQIDAVTAEILLENIDEEEAIYSHPQWMIERLKNDWPDSWQKILLSNNKQAPMTLRINKLKSNIAEYASKLEEEFECSSQQFTVWPSALILEQPRDVRQLPGYDEGWFSVQDAGAQLAAQILKPQAGDNILDACAAPGGKTSHLFEMQSDIKVTALDISESRLQRVEENCQRLGFEPTLMVADATDTDAWWNGELFDKILLDVPCSALGVIRRHPDIKQLRRDDDIDALVDLQQEMLRKNWALLKPGGLLLYVTCSMLKVENEQQIDTFLNSVDDAQLLDLSDRINNLEMFGEQTLGLQLFPIEGNNDGFYYALIMKGQ